jgi:probable F420-dependent oxidoreductase
MRGTSSRMSLSLGLQSHAALHGRSGAGLVELGRVAEASGFDGVVIGDHVVLGNRLDRYPYPPVHFAQDASWMEPLSVLAAIAAVTSRLRLTTGVLVSPLRPAVLLAKTAATIDDISGGRLELGVDVGWQPEEFDAVGADFSARGQLLTDGIGACRALWGPNPAKFSSPTSSFTDLWCDPKPANPDGIPVLFSGSLHRRNLARIAELGNGWITHPGLPVDDIAQAVTTLRELFVYHERDPDTLIIRTRIPIVRCAPDDEPDFPASLAQARDYHRAGVTDLTVWMNSFIDDHQHAARRIEELGAAWLDTEGDRS